MMHIVQFSKLELQGKQMLRAVKLRAIAQREKSYKNYSLSTVGKRKAKVKYNQIYTAKITKIIRCYCKGWQILFLPGAAK